MPATASAQRRIARLATLTAVHRAFHWLHLHQPQLRQWQLEIVRIPAPPFGESARAAWFLDRFHQLGLTNIHLDDAGNVLAELAPESSSDTPCILLSAHLDTVFPADTPIEPIEEKGSPRIYAPGICDNAAGLTGLLAIAAALRYANIQPPVPILFAANVGEEGEGDLRGMRFLFTHGPYRRPTPLSPPPSPPKAQAPTPPSPAPSEAAACPPPSRPPEATPGPTPASPTPPSP